MNTETQIKVPSYSAWMFFLRTLIAMLLVLGVLGFWIVIFLGAVAFARHWGQ
jgi:hypothetical protein